MGRNDVLKFCSIPVLLCMTALLSCGASGPSIPSFDNGRSFKDLVRQIEFGPRIPGTESHAATKEWLAASLKKLTPNVATQTFSDIYAGKEAEMHNIVASFYPEKKKRVLLCAHWDSRPYADKDPDPANHTRPVPGANDGASGVAVLLEVARLITEKAPPVGVDIAFFDGEDGGTYSETESWLLGSRHFARIMPKTYRPEYAILLDMIGDNDLSLSQDVNSMYSAPALWERMTALSGKLGIPILSEKMSVVDDHIPLIDRGIPAIDLIDFEYSSWHTVSDTPDKCSQESLGKIGTLVLMLIYGE